MSVGVNQTGADPPDTNWTKKDDSQTTERDIILTGNGSRDSTIAAARGGALIGFESTNTRPPDCLNINFVDWPFQDVRDYGERPSDIFDAHLNIVKEEQPKYAVAPDIQGDVKPRDVYAWARTLEQHCDTVIIVPKTIDPVRVPSRFRVGIPCQNKFAGQYWNTYDYLACDSVHLLGGSPHLHYELIYGIGIPVESLDTSVPVTSAGWGDSWVVTDDGPRWQDTRGGHYGCIEYSYQTMRTELNQDRNISSGRERMDLNRPDWGKYETCGYPDVDLLHPDDDIPFPGREFFEHKDLDACWPPSEDQFPFDIEVKNSKPYPNPDTDK